MKQILALDLWLEDIWINLFLLAIGNVVGIDLIPTVTSMLTYFII